ncbi:hypothetical protein ACFQ0P_02930 [Microbacterium insulae]|uniref:YdhG-like domain-containing protein n=1 Tax=Microbacterium insulae TaxID=483014 RepID=A0ABW3AF01_9MICO
MEKVDDDVDAFLRDSARADDLIALDRLLREALPTADRVLWRGRMWGGTDQAIIGYRSISQPRPRGAEADWFLVGLAAQQNHLSIYVNAAEDGRYLVQSWGDRLGRVKIGAAAVTFRSAEDLDLDELRDLVVRAGEVEDERSEIGTQRHASTPPDS